MLSVIYSKPQCKVPKYRYEATVAMLKRCGVTQRKHPPRRVMVQSALVLAVEI